MDSDKNKNVLIAALYLKEASDLLKFELADISTSLLQVVKVILEQYKLDDNDMLSALAIVDDIKNSNNA